MGGSKCIGTIGSITYFGTYNFVLCREVILNSECPLLEVPLYLLARLPFVGVVPWAMAYTYGLCLGFKVESYVMPISPQVTT